MSKRVFSWGIVVIVSVILIWCGCQKKSEEQNAFARVGWKVISQEDFGLFKKMRRLYPSSMYELVYPERRSNATQCVETAAIFKKAKSVVGKKVKNSIDWQWKERFYPAQMFLFDVLDRNLGFKDEEIEKYYNANRENYKKVIKVTVDTDSTKTETTGVDSTDTTAAKKDAATKDSVIYRPLNAVRAEVARVLFLEKYPPTAEFYASMTDSTDSGKVVDSANVKEQWVQKKRRNIHDFFLKTFYKKHYGQEYPDSLETIFGEGKVITPEDMEMILQWLPASSREDYRKPDKQRYLVEWLLKWKLFYDEAKNMGFVKKKDVKGVIDWAWKYDVVLQYINDVVAEDIEKGITIDTSMCVYEHWDRTGRPDTYPDSAALANIVKSNIESKLKVALDEKIYQMRKKARVSFLQSDFVDELVKDPVALSNEADSLYGAGQSKDAEKIYKKLVDNFPFHPKGLNALVEKAKILTERERYHDAIKDYRRYLLFSSDYEKRCNIFFMIGFVYGEYLSKPELAEASYKWILKNTPECELSDDAEFMALHLDEPMISVDELQAEAKRQGRKIEETEPVSEGEVQEAEVKSES